MTSVCQKYPDVGSHLNLTPPLCPSRAPLLSPLPFQIGEAAVETFFQFNQVVASVPAGHHCLHLAVHYLLSLKSSRRLHYPQLAIVVSILSSTIHSLPSLLHRE
ncbi:hypothetical protein Ahy_A09g045535 isoform B [Arachis hypogaea]|uniref:Uncharacterized protein n=1 Tax=Arachis hypogaea TaxID=3818 RepID=A0A445BMI7_ARAHY|nr:hypothetical protein Ahy_A09g045535 isoform B [Arachis hypogaea]